MKYTYLFIDILTVVIPVVFSFHPKIRFYVHWKYLFPALGITSILFISWDILFTHLGIWWFNDPYVTGIKIANLPFEEVLFFFTIPYASVFLYYSVKVFFKESRYKILSAIVSPGIIIYQLFMILLFYDRLYTLVSSLSVIVLVIFLQYYKGVAFLGRFYFSFAILLIPFILVNGLLTGGMFLNNEIVSYNNFENSGIRILTIPLEDVSYCFVLILSNIWLYEYFFRKKSEVRSN